ncbi:glycosyltransferase family 4 protein [Brumimicrobium aurantiacum]|uniref:Glycosyltransferase family 1 protein n=1 Tax=Brumimicrobium aurantiacum TaxID=1737063 RepID=A0A3E1EVJ3_9FLAO|nr:glycosyltransferase family 1 protein [Brumimicrobium aurantiacum]RFC53542.1 glycosyltransferase family 1 protein [Brumimicrobium aurantiacum]
MRIGVNTRFLLKNKMEGFGWYTYETMLRITQQHPEHEFVFFFDRPFDDRFVFADNITPVVVPPPARHPILQRIWFDYSITKALKKHKCDLFVSPDGYISLKTEIPQLAVIHDLNFEHNPQDVPKSVLKFFKKRFPIFAKKAARICTVSEFSKKDIVKTYGIPEEKIDVTYNGVSPVFKQIEESQGQKIRDQYTKGKPFILFVGAIHKRKNVQRLIEAYSSLKSKGRTDHQLLIVGEPMWNSQAVNVDQSLEKFVHFTGHVALVELANIMGSASCLAFVSYFEGFGIPLIEAMQSGVPVLAGNKTSLPEIGGDAALYCDPFSVDDIAEKLEMILTDENLRISLIEKGLRRSEDFSWDYTARDLWKAILRMMNEERKMKN